jgi:nitrogen fixation/metabolism regulation signal transduction histidine kinase
MNSKDTLTFPALKNRLSTKEIENQKQLFLDKNLFAELLDSTPTCLVVLNEYRQIVYGNKAFKDLLKNKNVESSYGKRLGEVLNCERSFMTVEGCGTSEFCDTCGALNVILSSLKGEEDVQECRIIQKDTKEALDLRVWSRKLKLNNQCFSIFTFVDISHEKRRLALERIFFHDVLNSAGALSSYFHILNDSPREEIEETMPVISRLIDRLLEEIKAQRDLTQAENAELKVNLKNCNSLKIIKDLNDLFSRQFISEEKEIETDPICGTVIFISDEILISRVLKNMLKNALESSSKGSKIKIGCNLVNNKVQFFVNNPGYIPKKNQGQIFQRSFSTKGVGRGLGTYSMKIITERYLKGNIYFTTSETEGTTFTAEYPVNFIK